MEKWKSLKLRVKLNVTYALVVFALMAIVLLVVTQIIRKNGDNRQREQLETTVSFVNNIIEDQKVKSLNYVKLLMNDVKIRGSLYYASLSEGRADLNKVLSAVFDSFDLNILEVGLPNGEVFFRAHNKSVYGDSKTEQPIIKDAIEGKIVVNLEEGNGGYAIRAVGPLKKTAEWSFDAEYNVTNEELVGTIMTGYYLDNNLSDAIKRLRSLAKIN